MNLIAKLLPAQNVVLDLDVSSKKRVFEHASTRHRHGALDSEVLDDHARVFQLARQPPFAPGGEEHDVGRSGRLQR